MKKFFIGVVATVLMLFAPTAAFAAGSDAPTPYTVDISGITLPAGSTFLDNGHVNIKTTQGDRGMHFEGKCIERTDAECAGTRHDQAQFIGKSFIPWSAFGLSGDFCVSWVQISNYNEHYGEGGQPPVCTNPPVEEPQPDPVFRWVDTVTESVPDCETRTVLITTTSAEESAGFYKGNDGQWWQGDYFPTGNTKVTTDVRDATDVECPQPPVNPEPFPEFVYYADATCDSVVFWHNDFYDQNGVLPQWYEYSIVGEDFQVFERYTEPGYFAIPANAGKVSLIVKASYGTDAVDIIDELFVVSGCTVPEEETPEPFIPTGPDTVIDIPQAQTPLVPAVATTPKVEQLANTGSSSPWLPITAAGSLIVLAGITLVIARKAKHGNSN